MKKNQDDIIGDLLKHIESNLIETNQQISDVVEKEKNKKIKGIEKGKLWIEYGFLKGKHTTLIDIIEFIKNYYEDKLYSKSKKPKK